MGMGRPKGVVQVPRHRVLILLLTVGKLDLAAQIKAATYGKTIEEPQGEVIKVFGEVIFGKIA